MNLKKVGSYLRVNLLWPGPRLMEKEFTGPRSHKGWETFLSILRIHRHRATAVRTSHPTRRGTRNCPPTPSRIALVTLSSSQQFQQDSGPRLRFRQCGHREQHLGIYVHTYIYIYMLLIYTFYLLITQHFKFIPLNIYLNF